MTYMARYLGPAGYGVLTFALAFTSIFSVFTDFNLQLLIAREVARDEKSVTKYMANITVMKIAMSIITFILLAVVINLLGYPWQTVQVVYLLGLSIIFMAFTQMFYAVFQAYQRLEFQAIGQLLNAVLMTVLVIIAVNMKLDVAAFGYMYIASALAVLIFCIFIWNLVVSQMTVISKSAILEIDWNFWKEVIREAIPFGLAAIFVTTFYWISTVLLSLMKGNEAVGYYNASYRLVLVLSFLPTALIGALYPAMSKLFVTSQETFRLYHEKAIKYLIMIAIPIGVGTTLLAREIVLSIFGKAYLDSVMALQILIWSEVFIFMSMPIGNLFNSLNKQHLVTWITGACLILNIGLNLILIPICGINGASITTVATEALSLILSYIWAVRLHYGPTKEDIKDFSKILCSSLVMGVFLLYFHELNFIVLILIAAIIYFGILIIIRGIGKQDLTMVIKMIRNEEK
jgi:O-antigen/teichoic acid export membrane protein